MSSDDSCCVVAKLVDSRSESSEMDRVCAAVSGRQLPLSSIDEFNSVDTIKKVRNCFYFQFFKHVKIKYRDRKEPSLLGFGFVWVLTKVRVRFCSGSSKCRKFRFGSGSILIFSVLSLVRFYMSSAV